MITIFKKLNQKDAQKLFSDVSDWFEKNPRRRVCKTDVFDIRRKHIKEDILKHSEDNVSLRERERTKRKKKELRVVYGVQWIEVEFGQRPEGYLLFVDKKKCIADTKKSSARGPYEGGGGYCGPVRPLSYVVIPFDSLEPEYQEKLEENGKCFTSNWWSPKFKGETHHI